MKTFLIRISGKCFGWSMDKAYLELFTSRRGFYQLARAWANYPEETGRYTHGVFEEADKGSANSLQKVTLAFCGNCYEFSYE
ncbi:hypothetical protein NPIL_90621 [Nephila pilipes]|uniref:Uncharacterized protein n=1 Tax=Nephila pilipes TaxID=299642 RepID=A0A8X6NE00_NEPPI|nr:hypothetical protein NPIL_90621 [Nephila pilipes]